MGQPQANLQGLVRCHDMPATAPLQPSHGCAHEGVNHHRLHFGGGAVSAGMAFKRHGDETPNPKLDAADQPDAARVLTTCACTANADLFTGCIANTTSSFHAGFSCPKCKYTTE